MTRTEVRVRGCIHTVVGADVTARTGALAAGGEAAAITVPVRVAHTAHC
jgi:hypothetical protein